MRLIHHFSEIRICFSRNPSQNRSVIHAGQNNLKSERFLSAVSLWYNYGEIANISLYHFIRSNDLNKLLHIIMNYVPSFRSIYLVSVLSAAITFAQWSPDISEKLTNSLQMVRMKCEASSIYSEGGEVDRSELRKLRRFNISLWVQNHKQIAFHPITNGIHGSLYPSSCSDYATVSSIVLNKKK